MVMRKHIFPVLAAFATTLVASLFGYSKDTLYISFMLTFFALEIMSRIDDNGKGQ